MNGIGYCNNSTLIKCCDCKLTFAKGYFFNSLLTSYLGGLNPWAHQKWLKIIISTINGSSGGGGGGSGNGIRWTSLFLKKTYIRDLKMKINNSYILEALNKWYTLYMHIYIHKMDILLITNSHDFLMQLLHKYKNIL